MNSTLIKILAAFTFAAMIIVNFLANYIPINNITPGEVSDMYPNLFAPAGFTFSIWGIIYLLLGAYTLYYLGLFRKGKAKSKLLDKISIYFIITSVANFFWIFAWHYQIIWLSLLLIIAMLYFLIKIASLLAKEKLSPKEYFFIALPFSIYFGWITVATIANVTVFLVSINWGGFGISSQVWTILVLLIGAAIGIWRMLKDHSIAYGLVFVWAYIGIWAKHASEVGFGGQYPAIIYTLIFSIVLFIVSIGYILYRNKVAIPKKD